MMTMRKLILIRHSQSLIKPQQPPAIWPLTSEGYTRCLPLAAKLTAYQLSRILTSTEVKAVETGRIIAEYLNIPYETAPGLHEHEYAGEFLNQEAFQTGVAHLFAEPDRPVFGEPGSVALARFQQAVAEVFARYPAGNLAIVTHGRVLSLFLAARTGKPAYDIWHALKMPDYRVISINS